MIWLRKQRLIGDWQVANPLQPKVIKVLENEYGAFVINVTSSSKRGNMDLVACISRCLSFKPIKFSVSGLFYGFEIKWKSDRPSELQKQKINDCIDAGGRAYFIKSVDQLRYILDNDVPPVRYQLKPKLEL